MELEKKGLILSTLTLPGNNQMALDLHCLKRTISNPKISFTLRFYFWEGYWLSLGYHQKLIPPHWEKLLAEEEIKIVKRPSGGGAVLHSGGITYALTFNKKSNKSFNYAYVNNWLIKSFKDLGINLKSGHLKKSTIKENCFGTSYISDLVDEDGYKRIGSAQYRKNGSILQHGEIQIDPPQDLWLKLFREKAPPKINLNLNNNEIIRHLKNSFLEDKSNLEIKNIEFKNNKDLSNFLKS